MKKLFMLCCASLLAACSSQTPPAQASLDGEVFYLQRIALPPAATLSVELQDVSLLDARSKATCRCRSTSPTIRARSNPATAMR